MASWWWLSVQLSLGWTRPQIDIAVFSRIWQTSGLVRGVRVVKLADTPGTNWIKILNFSHNDQSSSNCWKGDSFHVLHESTYNLYFIKLQWLPPINENSWIILQTFGTELHPFQYFIHENAWLHYYTLWHFETNDKFSKMKCWHGILKHQPFHFLCVLTTLKVVLSKICHQYGIFQTKAIFERLR